MKLLPSLGCVVLLAGLWSLPAAAAVYKWVDADGKVHFSDQPQSPSAKKLGAEVKDTEPDTAVKNKKGDQVLAEKIAASKKKAQDAEKKNKEAEEKAKNDAIKAENCKKAQQNLKLFQSGRRLRALNEDGNPVPMTAEQREQEVNTLQDAEKQYCNDN